MTQDQEVVSSIMTKQCLRQIIFYFDVHWKKKSVNKPLPMPHIQIQ